MGVVDLSEPRFSSRRRITMCLYDPRLSDLGFLPYCLPLRFKDLPKVTRTADPGNFTP